MDFFEAPSIHLKLSQGRARSPLSVPNTVAMLRRLIGLDGGASKVEKAQIWGARNDEDGEARAEFIDLISDRVYEEIELATDGRDRAVPFEQRKRALYQLLEAWQEQ